ncbi:MAG TPA: FtsX-like permease family protein [Patescibacteria group bacterium]|nr:FtsX-like permease family protein [Patescibacteria group bacterium]
MNVFTRGVRNAFRNSIRAIAIVGMLGLSIGLALSMLLANKAVGQKIDNVKKNIGNVVTVSPAGIRGFQGGGDALTQDEINSVKKVAHVTSVDTTLSDRLESTNTNLASAIDAGSFGQRQMKIDNNNTDSQSGQAPSMPDGAAAPDMSNFKMPLTVTGASNPLKAVTSSGGGALTLSSGSSFDGTKDANVALVGKSLAEKNSLKVGSTFTAYGTTSTVSGIFDSGSTFGNNQIIMPLPTVQRLSSQANAITGATANIDSAQNLDSSAAAITKALGTKADVTTDAASAKATLSSLSNIKNVSMFSLIGAAGTAAAIILLTMIMIVRERRREIGVLKAIGGSNIRVMLQFTAEAITLTVLGAVIGMIIGSIGATPVTKMLANNSSSSTTSTSTAVTTQGPGGGGMRGRFENNSVAQGVKNLKANVDASILLYGLGGAILIAAIGSTVAAGFIAKVRPAEVMRTE